MVYHWSIVTSVKVPGVAIINAVVLGSNNVLLFFEKQYYMFVFPSDLSPNILNKDKNLFFGVLLVLVLGNSSLSGLIMQPWFQCPVLKPYYDNIHRRGSVNIPRLTTYIYIFLASVTLQHDHYWVVLFYTRTAAILSLGSVPIVFC